MAKEGDLDEEWRGWQQKVREGGRECWDGSHCCWNGSHVSGGGTRRRKSRLLAIALKCWNEDPMWHGKGRAEEDGGVGRGEDGRNDCALVARRVMLKMCALVAREETAGKRCAQSRASVDLKHTESQPLLPTQLHPTQPVWAKIAISSVNNARGMVCGWWVIREWVMGTPTLIYNKEENAFIAHVPQGQQSRVFSTNSD